MQSGLAKMAVATGVMAGAAGGVYALLDLGAGLDVERGVEALAVVAAATAAGGGVYLATTAILGLDEPRVLLGRIRPPPRD
jgi:hypothetical protein